jgi:hypothetical protein
MVDSMLKLHRRFLSALEKAFSNDEAFAYAMKVCADWCHFRLLAHKLYFGLQSSFESAVNARQRVPSELIAKHVDTLLKSGKVISIFDDRKLVSPQC